MKKVLAFALCLALVLTCAAAMAEGATYSVLYSGEVTTLNYLTSSNSNEQAIGANVIDTLVEYDSEGKLQPSLASEWSYDEATMTWTFKIREGQKWVDNTGAPVADVTANDFVSAMQWVLTPENASSTASIVFGVIANAEEYFNGLAGEEGFEVIPFDQVGIKAVDDYTLAYTMAKPVPYFESMLTYVTFMPAYGPMLEEQGAAFATSAETMLYNGAYYISTFDPQVKRVYTKNALNWDAEHVYIDEIICKFNAEASTIGPEMITRGEIDYATLDADLVDAWRQDANTAKLISMERPALDFAYFYMFNFNVHQLDDNYYRSPELTGYSIDEQYEPANWEIAVNNENFRQSLRYAINKLSTYYVATQDVAIAQAYMQKTVTPAKFSTNPVTGVDFTDEAAFADIQAAEPFNPELAASYKAAAMEELAAQGVTFPVKVLVRYNPSTTNWEKQSLVLEQQMEAVLGTDFVDIIVEAGPSSGFLNVVRRSSDWMLMLCNWGADYADPETWTDPFYQAQNADGSYNRGMRYAYFAYAVTDNLASADTVKEYFALVEAAKEITEDMNARYAAFATAEAYLIDHALVVPYGTSVSDYVATKLNVWEGQYASFGISNSRYKGMKVYDNYITMDDYNANAK